MVRRFWAELSFDLTCLTWRPAAVGVFRVGGGRGSGCCNEAVLAWTRAGAVQVGRRDLTPMHFWPWSWQNLDILSRGWITQVTFMTEWLKVANAFPVSSLVAPAAHTDTSQSFTAQPPFAYTWAEDSSDCPVPQAVIRRQSVMLFSQPCFFTFYFEIITASEVTKIVERGPVYSKPTSPSCNVLHKCTVCYQNQETDIVTMQRAGLQTSLHFHLRLTHTHCFPRECFYGVECSLWVSGEGYCTGRLSWPLFLSALRRWVTQGACELYWAPPPQGFSTAWAPLAPFRSPPPPLSVCSLLPLSLALPLCLRD